MDSPPAFGRTISVPVGISGMAWFEPPDRDRPANKIRIEAPPSLALIPGTLPTPISGMGWFAPKPDSVVVRISFSQAPALQQPIIQIAPPADDGTRGTETFLTDRRGSGRHLTKKRWLELLDDDLEDDEEEEIMLMVWALVDEDLDALEARRREIEEDDQEVLAMFRAVLE